MSLAIPSGTSVQSLEKDTVTLTVDATHSVGKPHVVIIDRKAPVFNGTAFSQPRYRIRVIRGNQDADNKPIPARTLADLEFAWAVGNSSATIKTEILDVLTAVLNSTGFAAAVFDQQLLPS